MPEIPVPVDRAGMPLSVGTRVRLLEIAAYLKDRLPADEWEELHTMVGEVFEVFEIDEYGHTWIEKWFEGRRRCHSLAVEAHEVEIVA